MMNSKALTWAALRGLETPRVPVGPLAVHFCAGVAGYTLRQYTTSPRNLAESILRYYEQFKPDAVWLSSDTWVSAEAMGARVGAAQSDQPFGGLGEPLILSPADIDRIPRPDVTMQGRYPLMLEALSQVVEQIGDEAFTVACFDQYPFSLATALMGINEIMLKVYDDPPFVQALMDRCAEYAVAYARALGAAGADLLSGGDSPAGLLGPEFYERIALPSERNVISQIKTDTRKPVSLHICGKATPLLPLMATAGADVLELDHAVPISEACRALGRDIALWGNLDPVALLARGTPSQVRAEARRAIADAQGCGHRRFILSSGCTLAVETPAENLSALIAAARE
jgi:uroporphyrinogen decarboxylase